MACPLLRPATFFQPCCSHLFSHRSILFVCSARLAQFASVHQARHIVHRIREQKKITAIFGFVKALSGGQQGRAVVFKTHRKCRFSVDCICTHAACSQPPERETCARDAAAACIRMPRSNGPQSIPRPNTTESKTLHVELYRTPQLTSANQKRAMNHFWVGKPKHTTFGHPGPQGP